LREGRSPRKRRPLASPIQSFEALARDWHQIQSARWTAGHADDVLTSLERLVFPALGAVHVNDITPPMMLSCLREIEAAGTFEICHRVRQRASAVFVYAIACGIGQNDPAAIVRGALAPLSKRRPMPALIDLADLRTLLRRTESAPGYPATKCALRLLAISACRPGEVRGAQWAEFEDLDGDTPLWRIPASRMKTGIGHAIPLPGAAVAIVEALRPLTGMSPFLFAGARTPHAPIGRNALLQCLDRCGYGGVHSAHGFRAAFSSIMNERYPDAHDAIEAQLAHIVKGVRGAYMRAPFLERRRTLLAKWADLLLEGSPDAPTLLLGPRR
jgi:integrase